jgi:hypothetical protein
MGGGDGGIGGQAGFPLETWFWEMPLCTRWWTTATVLTSALVQCQIVTPFQLFYSFRAVFVKSQVNQHSPLRPSPTADNFLVLASPHYVSLLWSPITGSRFSCFLPPTIFSITRRVIRTIAGTVCLVITVCNDLFDMPLPFGINAISWPSIIVYISLYLVEAEPRHPFEFPWPSSLHSAIPSMGIDGIQLDTPWHDSKGRDYGSCDWTRMVLLLGCLPTIA